ncbi:MAG TPA: RHS repeat-associated core domain-containing protein [Nonomuraea sp.]|nr:RHS repeat-associated core domain-containing protein [Nonomuraea sp.]
MTTTSAQAPTKPSEPDKVKPVRGKNFVPPPAQPDPEAAPDRLPAAKASWPAAGAAEVALPAAAESRSADSSRTRAGSLPVWVSAAAGRPGPERVRVELLDRDAAERAGVTGVLISLRRLDGKAEREPVTVTVDYSAFKDAYGGDWASRLRLVPQDGGDTPVTALHNDPAAATVSAEVPVGDTASTFAVTAGSEGPKGDYKATSLTPSALWQVSTQSGNFTWGYELRTPPVPGELSPELALSYSSGSVDGRTVATNNQPSWVGEGWNLSPGFIERSYRGCAEDLGGNNGTTKTGDLCWETDNATLSFGEQSGRLVLQNGVWRPQHDDGTRVERLVRNDPQINGDDNGEYWKVTTTDGTQYFFGLNRLPGWASGRDTTGSTWTVPVFGNDTDEPCRAATFAASACPQAYRWNLDYVVDAHGNSMSYFYEQEINRYAQNRGQTTGTYVRGGTLARIDYGTRAGAEYSAQAPAQVVFDRDDRCVPGQLCASHTTTAWPDVPWDTYCAAAPCGTKYSPTFWSTKRLSKVTTRISTGGGNYRNVDQWELAHTYPPVNDGTGDRLLWLNGITHTGLAATTAAALPAVTFDATMMPNRVNFLADGLPKLNKPRLTKITSESGGAVNISYLPPDCAPGALPAAAETNTKRCFPQRWTMPPATEPVDDWFHKYVVSTVVEDDLLTDAKDVVTKYEYDTKGGAWAYVDDPLLDPKRRTWAEWRGYEKVVVREGDPVNDANKPQTRTQYLYFRGMHGDRLNRTGGTKIAKIKDSTETELDDLEPLAGFLREEISYDGTAEVTGEINDPFSRLTATQGSFRADQVEIAKTVTRERRSNGTYRVTQVESTYDDYGNVTKVNDLGDLAGPGDDQCTTTTYAHNLAANLVEFPSRTTTVGVACGANPTYPDDAISDTKLSYDGQTHGTAPLRGDVTKTEVANGYSGSTATYQVDETSAFDQFGREKESRDALGKATTTVYEDTNGLNTGTKVTNPLQHTVTTTLDPAWGHPLTVEDANGRKTTRTYDGLGRVTAVYEPGRSASAGDSPNARYAYGVLRSGGPNWVRTSRLRPNGNHVATYELYDGFLRLRQTQVPSPAGGSVLTDTLYDSRGLAMVTRSPYYGPNAAGTAVYVPDAGAVPASTITTYDGVERKTAEIFMRPNASGVLTEQWRTTTSYSPDWVSEVPPAGGTATTKWIDARDRTTALVQYHSRAIGGTGDTTRYSYTKRGDLAKVTDAAGNVWRYTYDVLGRKLTAEDPDNGTTRMTYDAAGQLKTVTDARGKTVEKVYDDLGREVETHFAATPQTPLTKTVYDTLSKGDLTSSTRYVNGHAYEKKIAGYDAAARPTGTSVVIPEAEGDLAGTYTTSMTYKPDGSVATRTLPALGNLAEETLNYDYDDLGRPDSIEGAQTYAYKTEYNELGETAQVELGEVGKQLYRTTYYEEGTRRVTEVLTERDNADGGALVNQLTYGYDALGNITRVSDRTTGLTKDTQCVTLDHLRRITAAWTQSTDACAAAPSASVVAGPAPYWHEYTYDTTGNRKVKTVKGLGGAADVTTTYSYPQPGDGVTRPHAVTATTTGTTTAAYTYNAAGATLTRPGPTGQQTLTWDDEGLLTSIAAGGRTTSYVYDADDQQLIRRDPGSVTLFVGDGELRLNTTTGSKTGTRYYDGIGTRTGDGFTWTIADHHGTDLVAVDAGDLTVTSRRLDLFGNPRGTAAAWPAGSLGFVGGTKNPETELTRLGAREYDPETSRFVSVDPVIDPFDPQQMNAYAYGNNNPATMTDPDGLKYFESDSRGSVHVPRKASKPKRSFQKPRGWKPRKWSNPGKLRKPRRPTSIARMKDFGGRCEGGKSYCSRPATHSRARQHDWNGAGGPRGHVGGAPTHTRTRYRNEREKVTTKYVEGMLVEESVYTKRPLNLGDWSLVYRRDAIRHTIYDRYGTRTSNIVTRTVDSVNAALNAPVNWSWENIKKGFACWGATVAGTVTTMGAGPLAPVVGLGAASVVLKTCY